MSLDQIFMLLFCFGVLLHYLGKSFRDLESKLLRSNWDNKKDLENRLEILESKMFDIEEMQTERLNVKLSDIQTRLRSIEDNTS